MPGCGEDAGPLLKHLVETIADGVSWIKSFEHGSNKSIFKKCQFVSCCVYSATPPHGLIEAPAKKMAEHGDALQLELGECSSSLHHSTRSVMKGTLKNASRQYQRATRRFNLAMSLYPTLFKLLNTENNLFFHVCPNKLYSFIGGVSGFQS